MTNATMQRVLLSRIQWDTDGEESTATSLPEELIVSLEVDAFDDEESLTERAIDRCSDATGWAIADCEVLLIS